MPPWLSHVLLIILRSTEHATLYLRCRTFCGMIKRKKSFCANTDFKKYIYFGQDYTDTRELVVTQNYVYGTGKKFHKKFEWIRFFQKAKFTPTPLLSLR